MLKIQVKGSQSEAIWIVEKLYVIGRAPTNNLVLDDDSISPVHAKLITRNNKLFLKDNHSEHGCFVNRRRVTQMEVMPGDVIRLGRVEIEVLAPREHNGAIAAGGDKAQPKPEAKKTDHPKQWKTRPTSPGNRIEPAPPKRSGFVIWLSVGLCAIMVGAVAYLFSLR